MSKRKARPIYRFGRPRGALRDGLELDFIDGPRPGRGVVVADPGAVAAALERFDPDAPWKKVRDRVLPMLPRVRPVPGRDLELVRAMLPPGVLVNFGIDVGPAVVFVGTPLLDRWQIDAATLIETALENVRRLADDCDRADVLDDHVAGVPVSILQARFGIAASILLVPEHIERFFGRGPHLLLAPMRDLLLALPASVDREFAAWLAEELEAIDPNHLHLGGFRHERGSITPEVLDEAAARA
jgi:hypothetical protein